MLEMNHHNRDLVVVFVVAAVMVTHIVALEKEEVTAFRIIMGQGESTEFMRKMVAMKHYMTINSFSISGGCRCD